MAASSSSRAAPVIMAPVAPKGQLGYAARAGRPVQAMHPFEQRVAVAVPACLADRLAVGIQRGEQHAQHVGGQVGLAGGQAQAFLGVEHAEMADGGRPGLVGLAVGRAQV